MKAWLRLALALSIFCAASAQLDPVLCGSDEILNSTANTCECNMTMYNSTALPPSPTVQCLSGQMNLTVSKCQLEKDNYDWTNLYLLDSSCVGYRVVDGIAKVFVSTHTSSHECQNVMTSNGSYVFYSNNLTIPAKVYPSGLIVRNNLSFAFTCSYPLNIAVSLATTVNVTMGVTDIVLPGGVGAVTVVMLAYTDPAFAVAYTTATMGVNVQDPLYVSVAMPDLDASAFSVLVTRLYATATSDPNATPAFDIITGSCPSAQLGDLLTVNRNGNGTEAHFTVKVFQIAGSSSLYLHAVAQICVGNPCNQTCGSIRISGGAGTNSAKLSSGPYIGAEVYANSGPSSRFSWIWTVNSLLLSLLGLRLL